MKGDERTQAMVFLFGVFVSALGSTSFIVSLLSFPLKMGVSAAVVGIAVGAHRMTSVAVNFFWGPLGDRLNPRKIIFYGEAGALICSVGILASSYTLSNDNYLVFTVFVALRSIFTGIQTASIQKVGKLFDESLGLKGKFAAYLNKATFGTIFFAMGLNLLFLKYGSFQHAIAFDALSFLVNGLLILAVLRRQKAPALTPVLGKEFHPFRLWSQNKLYFSRTGQLARQDVLLAFVMMGANTLNVILLFDFPDWIPLASGVFGISVWLSTPIEKWLKPTAPILWLILGLSIAAQGFFTGHPILLLCFSFFRNVSYWILYNRISSGIMHASPAEIFASISAGRQVTINLIGAIGEFWVGAKLLPAVWETAWRGITSLIGSVFYRPKAGTLLGFILVMALLPNEKSSAGELNLGIRSLTINQDPQSMEDVSSLLVNRQIHRGLMRYTSQLELVKDLVLNYEILDSGKTYRFNLGEHFFSDGSPILAQDVVLTFRRLLKLNSAIVADLQTIIGFKEKEASKIGGLGIKAISERSVEFRLEVPDSFFLKNLAAVDCSLLKLNEKLEIQRATSGYYKLEAAPDQLILSLVNQKKAPEAPTKIIFYKVETENSAIELARKGILDTLESFEVSQVVEEELKQQGWKSYKGQSARLLFLSLNSSTLDDELRKQIFTLFNRRDEIKPFSEDYSFNFGLVPNLLPGNLTSDDTKKLEAKGPLLPPKVILDFQYPSSTEFEAVAKWSQAMLQAKGFRVKISPFQIDEYFKIIKAKKYQILLRSKYLEYPDGMSFLTYFKSGLPINTFDAGGPEVDKLIEAAQKENQSEKRSAQYKGIQLALLRQYTLVPLFTGSTLSALWSKKVKSVQAHPMGFHSLYFHEIEMAR